MSNEEIFRFITIPFLMAQVKRLKLVHYWSKDSLLSTFSLNRLLPIVCNLHFVDNNSNDESKGDLFTQCIEN